MQKLVIDGQEIRQFSQQEAADVKKEFQEAESIAKLMIDHSTNEKGEILANVHENSAFQNVYDYSGVEAKRWRLERKKEQVHN